MFVRSIERVLLKHAGDAFRTQEKIGAEWAELNYAAEPNFEKAKAEYESFAALLNGFGIETVFLPDDADTSLDSIYVRDAVLMTDSGAVLFSMGKPHRRSEPTAIKRYLEATGIPVFGEIGGGGNVEGGDIVWLDNRTIAVGEGYRSNKKGIDELREILSGRVDEIIPVPLPHWNGPSDVLHLMSFLSPIDENLALVYSRLMPAIFRNYLLKRGVYLIEVPDEEYNTMACNVLALAPGKCLMLSGNDRTRSLLEERGVEVLTYDGDEISRKGSGGPTCLTSPYLQI